MSTRPSCHGSQPATYVGMSALGHERTLVTMPFYVCFTPESGHSQWAPSMSAKCHKRTSRIGPARFDLLGM